MSLLKLTFKETEILSADSHDSDDNGINESDTSKSSADSLKVEEETKAESSPRTEVPPITTRIMNFCRELAIFCFIMITYAALTKDPPKVSKAPAAYPFFMKGAFVTDWYRGEISKAIESARSGDIAFVMFYAPWDAESQRARKEFEIAAEYMSEYVNFAAVNCWQPHSECRNQYSKVYRWPVLIAYLAHGRGVQYSGPITAFHIIKFLKKVSAPFSLMPMEYPKDFEDAYIVAELNSSPGSLDFAVLYSTALKYLEKDPQYRITFYVKPTATSEPRLCLHLWNETLIYPTHDLPWLPEDILYWVIENMHQLTAWVAPSGSKSLTISNSMSNGVALILFTPKNILHIGVDYYTMLQEIAQEFYSCKDDVSVNFNSVNLEFKRSAALSTYKKFKSTCKLSMSNHKTLSYNVTPWTNMSNFSHVEEQKNSEALGAAKHSHNVCLSYLKSIDCKDIVPLDSYDETFCPSENENFQIHKTSLLTGINDPKSAQNLQKIFHQHECKQFLMAEELHPAIFEQSDSDKRKFNISKLSCRSNKSLTLLAMDSLLYYPFAQRLGINLTEFADKSAAVILNEKMESHYILQGPINGFSLREFIMNYTLDRLNRSFDSMSTLNLTKETRSTTKKVQSEIAIKQLNTNSFLPTILQKNKAIVVFYYTKQCSFCNGIAYMYLTVAKKMSLVENLLFTRIDGELNILPWEYSMETYPTILFLPSKRKSESRVFPSGMSINVFNLTGFILTNLEPDMKLQAIWSLCRHTKLAKEQASCYSSLLNETLGHIDATLKTWRKSNKRLQQVLLHRLKLLRHVHLLFAHRPQREKAIRAIFQRLTGQDRQDDYRGSGGSSGVKDEL